MRGVTLGIMIVKRINLKAIVAATALTVSISAPMSTAAWANDPERDLLAKLGVASREEATDLQREILSLWRRSGSPAMDLLLDRGIKALEHGDVAAAIEHLTALTDHAPEFARGWYERARAYHIAGRFGPAVADLERALALNPNDFEALFALGNVFEQFRDPANAYQVYLRAKAIHPHHEGVISALERLAPSMKGVKL